MVHCFISNHLSLSLCHDDVVVVVVGTRGRGTHEGGGDAIHGRRENLMRSILLESSRIQAYDPRTSIDNARTNSAVNNRDTIEVASASDSVDAISSCASTQHHESRDAHSDVAVFTRDIGITHFPLFIITIGVVKASKQDDASVVAACNDILAARFPSCAREEARA